MPELIPKSNVPEHGNFYVFGTFLRKFRQKGSNHEIWICARLKK